MNAASSISRLKQKIHELELERDAALERVRELERDKDAISSLMELTPSEERFRALADSIPHMIWSARPDGFVDYYSQRTLDYAGMTMEQAKGWNWLDALHPEDRQRAFVAWGQALRDGTEFRLEARIRNGRTGEYRWFRAHVVPKRDEYGSILRWYGTCTDIQNHKQVEQRLQKSEEDFREAFAHAPIGMVLTSLDGRFLHVNPAYCHIVGYSREELLRQGYDFKKLTHPEDLDANLSEIDRMVSGEIPAFFCEKRYRHRDGSTVWVRASGSVRRDAAGRPFQIVGLVEDITDRKRAEQERDQLLAELGKTARELEAIINSMTDGVVIYDGDGNIIRINPAAEQITGFGPEDFSAPIEERWGKIRTPDGQPVPLARVPVSRALRGEIVKGDVMVLHAGAGESVWVSLSASPIHFDGEVNGAVVTFTDITELRQIQQEREIFLHTITHDLRTPLTVIMGYSELLWNEITAARFDKKLAAQIKSILHSGQLMTKMMEDLEDFARLETGKIKVEPEPIELSAYIADYLGRAGVAMDTNRIEVEVTPGLPPVSADPKSLERILGNLIGNALKYSEDVVRISAKPEEDAVLVSITDRGPGIAPKDLPRVFDRFFRVEETKKEGFGLGLYITRFLVEAQNGQIWVESNPGEGSTFFFTLPSAQNRIKIA